MAADPIAAAARAPTSLPPRSGTSYLGRSEIEVAVAVATTSMTTRAPRIAEAGPAAAAAERAGMDLEREQQARAAWMVKVSTPACSEPVSWLASSARRSLVPN